jgi:hypothetical protein
MEIPPELQMFLLKSYALPGYLMHPGKFPHQKLMTGGLKEALWLILNWVGRNRRHTPWSRATTQNPL